MSPAHSPAQDDPSLDDGDSDDQRTRSLIVSAQAAADRIAGEVRALSPLSPLPVASHEALLGSARASGRTPR